MFTAARSLLAAKEMWPRTHRGVVSQFGLSFVKEGFVADLEFKAFAEAKERREEVDYESRRVSEEEADQVLGDAASFIESVRAALRKLRSFG